MACHWFLCQGDHHCYSQKNIQALESRSDRFLFNNDSPYDNVFFGWSPLADKKKKIDCLCYIKIKFNFLIDIDAFNLHLVDHSIMDTERDY